ncbi:MAG: L-dopachrome tautomerase-related protein [Lysobacterales bacterium]
MSLLIRPMLSSLLLFLFAGALFAADSAPMHNPKPVAKPAPPPPSELQLKLAGVDDVHALLVGAAEYEKRGDFASQIAVFERVLQLRPMAGNIQYELAAAHAQLDHKRQVYDLLLKLQTSGYAYDPSEDPRFEKAHGTEVWDYLLLNLAANAKPFGEGRLAFTLPKGDTLIDAIGYDAKRKQFLAGSARDGAVYRVNAADGKLLPFIAADDRNQLRAVTALQADDARGHLWVAASGLAHFRAIKETDFGKTALYQFDLASGKLLKRYDMPVANGPHQFDHLLVTRPGQVFVADSKQKRIYRLEDGAHKLIMQNPRLRFVRGLAASDDGRLLYFADTELGIFAIDLVKNMPVAVTGPATLTLFGIDGLYYWNNHLVVIQNAFPPNRVMRLDLDESGLQIKNSMPLDAGHPELTAPTRGVVVDDHLYFIANTQKTNYDRYGLPIDKERLEGVRVWSSDIRFQLGKTIGSVPIPVVPAKQ